MYYQEARKHERGIEKRLKAQRVRCVCARARGGGMPPLIKRHNQKLVSILIGSILSPRHL